MKKIIMLSVLMIGLITTSILIFHKEKPINGTAMNVNIDGKLLAENKNPYIDFRCPHGDWGCCVPLGGSGWWYYCPVCHRELAVHVVVSCL